MRHIVSAIITDERGRFLVAKRSPFRRQFPGKWHCVAGHVEGGEHAVKAAVREIHEELGPVVNVQFQREGQPLFSTVPGDWRITPILFRYVNGAIMLDAEHTEYRWVTREELQALDLVPHLLDDLRRVGA